MSVINEIEKKSFSEQQQLQFEKLQLLLIYLAEKSPYYRRRFVEDNTEIANIKSYKDLVKLPTTSKSDMQLYNWDFLCVSKAAVREYTATSGTLGTPVIIALTENDIERLAYNEYRSFCCMNVNQEDTFQLMLTLDRQFMAGMAYYGGLRKAGAAAVRTGPGLPNMQWDTIMQLQTTALVAVPSFLLKMISYAAANNIDLENSPVKKVLAIGESLRNENLAQNALASNILKGWNVKLYSTYASTEMQTAFTECDYGKGGHHQPDLIIIELLDEAGNPVPNNEAGEVTITTLGVEAMPLLRYRTGDICKGYYEACKCGRKTMRLGPVLGRKQQMIKFKGTSIYPPSLFDLLNDVVAIKEYYIEIRKNEDEQDELTIYIEAAIEPQLCDAVIKPTLRHKLRVIPNIVYVTAEEIQKLQFPLLSRKQVRISDLRN